MLAVRVEPVVLLLGKTRRRRDLAIGPVDADTLVVVDSARSARLARAGRPIVGRPATGGFGGGPRVALVSELLDELWLRFGDGRTDDLGVHGEQPELNHR